MGLGDAGKILGGIEAGGTKFVCAVGTGPDDIVGETRFPTTTPGETIGKAIEFFSEYSNRLTAVGISSFGPISVDKTSPHYGYITSTPKPGWQMTDITGMVKAGLGIPATIDTDVNGAVLAEHLWGAGQDTDNLVYLTVGTGIGGGGMVNGRLIHGLVHPEMGHIRIPHDYDRDPFTGCCPYHGDCLEGLASGKAVELRWNKRGEELPPDHPAWELEAEYLAYGLNNIICTLSPQRIIIGGGLMGIPGLLPKVREKVVALLAGYVDSPAITEEIDSYLVTPGLGERSGVLGAIALAKMAD
ncbi:MAG: ROK family protein [Dehalococcoidales bacterium]|nr:ROK family protein [Dehalococcoidales bacterium]